MSFDAREPNRTFDPQVMHPGFPHGRVPPHVLACVGEAFAAALCGLDRQLAEAAAGPAALRAQAVAAMRAETERLEHLGVQIQQVARVLAGEGLAAVERFDLADAARQAIAVWNAAAARRGVTLSGPVEPLAVDAVPGVIEQLLDLALEHALRIGTQVDVDAAMQGQPPRPMLSLHVQGVGAGDWADDLHWQLFVLLARANGLSPQRMLVGSTVTMMLGFAPAEDGQAAAPSPAALPRTPIGVDRRVLLLEPRDITRLHAHRLLQAAGMRVDATVSLEQARAAIHDQVPDILVTGVPSDEDGCSALIEALRALQPRLRVIDLVDDDSAFTLSLPHAGMPGRVGRRDLARTLLPAVSQELDAAWALQG
jgi:hypothetical protein